VAVGGGHVDDFDLHGFIRLTMALTANRPGIHLLGHMAHGRNFAHLVEVLDLLLLDDLGRLAHG
jgi:hypothetical protein